MAVLAKRSFPILTILNECFKYKICYEDVQTEKTHSQDKEMYTYLDIKSSLTGWDKTSTESMPVKLETSPQNGSDCFQV